MGNIQQRQMDNVQSKQNQQFLRLIYQHSQWQNAIKPTLKNIAQGVYSSSQLVEKMETFQFYSQTHRRWNPKRLLQPVYGALTSQYKKQMPDIWGNMADLILSYENKQLKFPILYSGCTKEHTFNKQEKLLLMSMMAMNLIPDQNFRYSYRFPGTTNFQTIFTEQKWKTKTIIQYFKMQFDRRQKLGEKYAQQKLTLKRYSLNQKLSDIIQRQKGRPLQKPIMKEQKQSIQDYFGDIKIDFANKFIGGGALTHGCVQQQIMFANHPQMFTSVLFCEMMKQDEAIQFIGYKKYFSNYGYGHTTGYEGLQKKQYDYDEKNRAKQRIVAIDALHYPRKKFQQQFTAQKINREILKAYAGFSCSDAQNKPIVTGNWGCGAFNGDKQLKFIIQLIASSLAGRQLFYIPFGYRKQLYNEKLYELMSKRTASELYKILVDSQEELKKNKEVFRFLYKKLNEQESKL